MDENDIPPARPAATLVIFRDQPDAAPDLLMVERSKGMAFAGGAVVFPGGRVDPDDHVLAARHAAYDADDAAARIAAIRETIEESLVAIGVVGDVTPDWLARAREWLHAQKPFSQLLDEAGFALDLSALHYFARWRPQHREARVFDTRFFIARAPADLPPPVVDETENVRTFWESASGVIELESKGRVKVIYPTMRNLERLAQLSSFDAALAHLAGITLETISPYSEEREDGHYLCIPEGQGYPVTSERLDMAVTAYSKDRISSPPKPQ